jgi:hypothetical protein
MDTTESNVMAIPKEHQMEQLHTAYITAVSALGGATYDPPRQDYGIDGRISEVRRFPNGKYRATNWLFNCQLKATTRFKVRDNLIVYEMDSEAYNRFVECDGDITRILIVFCLPKQWEDWLNISEDNLVLKNCCYWTVLSGEPSSNDSSKTIYIPRKNLFNAEAVQYIFSIIKSGENINGFKS